MPKTGARHVLNIDLGFLKYLHDDHLVHNIYWETYWNTEKQVMLVSFAKERVKWEVVHMI